MTTRTIEIAWGTSARTKKRRAVKAVVRGALALHETQPEVVMGVEAPYDGSWTVTHVPSGCAIGRFISKTAASRFLKDVEPLMDWSVARHGRDVPKAVKLAVQRLRIDLGESN